MESEDNQLPLMDYVDFENFVVEISAGEGRDYQVKVQSSLAGEATETMHFPFDEIELASRLKDLEIALLQSGGRRRYIPSKQEEAVQSFGKALFNALFTGKAGNLYASTKNQIDELVGGLRLQLRIKVPELAALPWEFLYDQDAADYICLSSNTPIVRYMEAPIPPHPLTVTPPLSILVMTAAPKNLVGLDIEREVQRLEKAIEKLQKSNKVKLTWLDGHTASDLQTALLHGPWHIFHFIGHGGFDPNKQEGFIALEDDNGFANYFRAIYLTRLLHDHHYLRLVVLNSCEGARGSQQDLFSSLAATLVMGGIPAVLAMQYAITDEAAVELSRVFYEALAEGIPVDRALGEARKAISYKIENTLEWGTPVLYMRSPNGVLFAVKPQSDAELQALKAEEVRKEKEAEQLRLAEEERVRKAKEKEQRVRKVKEEQLRLAEEERARKAKEEEERLRIAKEEQAHKAIEDHRTRPRPVAPQLPPIIPDSTKVMLFVSTMGQVDHGKTTLTAAITRVLNKENKANNYVPFDQIDNAPEVRYSGIPIASSQVEYQSGRRQYLHTDCPGHADYVKSMIAGPHQIDAAILVVSAPDGPMPHTREQIRIASQVGIPAMVVFLNKVDIMDDEELLELIELEVRELLSHFGFPGDDVPVIRGSALQALKSKGNLSRSDANVTSIWNLIDAMNAYIPMPSRASDKPFLMPVEDVFSIKGRGTIGTGRIEQGTIKVGDSVAIVGMQNASHTAVVTVIEMFQKTLDTGTVGDNIGCLLRGIEREDLERGQVLAKPGSIRAYKAFNAQVYIMTKEEGGRQTPFFNGYRPQFYIRTTDVTGAIRLPEGVEMVIPGDSIALTVELIQPVAMEQGVKFAIREGGRTVGAGICTGIVN